MTVPPMTAEDHLTLQRKRNEKRRMVEAARDVDKEKLNHLW